IDEPITLPVVAVAACSALLPDIDEPNSLLLSRVLSTRFLRFFQFVIVLLAIVIALYGMAYAPWNYLIALFGGSVAFLHNRMLRLIVMIITGVGLLAVGHYFAPWNYIIGCLL